MPEFELSADMVLRPLAEQDAEELYALIEANRSHLARWMPWAASQTLKGTAEFIGSTIEQERNDDGFQVALVSNGAIAGTVGHHGVDRQDRITSIGYWLAEDIQGRGVMTAAVERLTAHAFDELRLNRVEIRVAPDNLRSRAIPERLGFREEGLMQEAQRFDDEYRDVALYAALAAVWVKRSQTERAGSA